MSYKQKGKNQQNSSDLKEFPQIQMHSLVCVCVCGVWSVCECTFVARKYGASTPKRTLKVEKWPSVR